jgi:hypothetical protein
MKVLSQREVVLVEVLIGTIHWVDTLVLVVMVVGLLAIVTGQLLVVA